jgi:hypothetical protein
MKTKTRRLAAGAYVYEVNGKRFFISEEGRSEGGKKTLWQCSEITGPTDYHHGAPFDAALTLAEAKRYCDGSAT